MDTSRSVNTSAVGVMTVPMMRMMTKAWRLYLRRKQELMNPNFANSQHIIGNSNIKPMSKLIVMSVDM